MIAHKIELNPNSQSERPRADVSDIEVTAHGVTFSKNTPGGTHIDSIRLAPYPRARQATTTVN